MDSSNAILELRDHIAIIRLNRPDKRNALSRQMMIGLINRIAPEADLITQAELLAREISNLAPLAIRACLEAITRGRELPLGEGLALESQLFSSLFATNDMREGTQAFLDKRPPIFRGN